MTSDPVRLSAIESIYRQRFHRFLHVATAIAGGAEAGADAVQDAFASAVAHRESYRGEGPLEGWLWRILINAARQQARRRSQTPADPNETERSPASVETNGYDRDNVSAEVRTAVALLPDRQRFVLFLRYYADLDYQRIADVLGISSGTVGATLNQAHAALRPLMKEASVR